VDLQFLRNVRQRRFKIPKIRAWRRWMIYQAAKFVDPCKVHTVCRTWVYRWCPSPIPRCSAFWRSAPIVRFVSLDILATGVFAFECALSSLMSAFVHSRRTALPFFFAFLTFNLLAPH
jgi:hypothetical protein